MVIRKPVIMCRCTVCGHIWYEIPGSKGAECSACGGKTHEGWTYKKGEDDIEYVDSYYAES